MSNPKAQFQVNHGSGWETIAEADITDGMVQPPNAWIMVRALQKRICYMGCISEKITVAPSTPHDTHFAGFAKALLEELDGTSDVYLDFDREDDWQKDWQQVIARRAYDLALHVLEASGMSEGFAEGFIRGVPDLVELPKE